MRWRKYVQSEPPRPASFRRHLEGWQVGLTLVMCALVAAVLGVPRAIPSKEIPLPRIDRIEQRRVNEQDHALAMEALRESLPYELRAAGEAFRRYGALSARSGVEAAKGELADLKALTRDARNRDGDAGLLKLRAVESEYFVSAVRRFEASGSPSPDLSELGGDFLDQAKSRGWMDQNRINASADELATLFKIRWGTLVGLLDTYPFSPSLNEWRAYHSFLLRVDRPANKQDGQGLADHRLGIVESLARRDPDFPAALARGILLYQLGDYSESAETLRGYLISRRSGPWQLRATNALLASTAKLSGRP